MMNLEGTVSVMSDWWPEIPIGQYLGKAQPISGLGFHIDSIIIWLISEGFLFVFNLVSEFELTWLETMEGWRGVE